MYKGSIAVEKARLLNLGDVDGQSVGRAFFQLPFWGGFPKETSLTKTVWEKTPSLKTYSSPPENRETPTRKPDRDLPTVHFLGRKCYASWGGGRGRYWYGIMWERQW